MAITAIGSATNVLNTTRVYDKKDLNKDGIVSADEEMIYDLLHPSEAPVNTAASITTQSYNQQGKLTTTTTGQSTFDIYI